MRRKKMWCLVVLMFAVGVVSFATAGDLGFYLWRLCERPPKDLIVTDLPLPWFDYVFWVYMAALGLIASSVILTIGLIVEAIGRHLR